VKMQFTARFASAVAVIGLLSIPAYGGAIIYSDLGPSNAYSDTFGSLVSGAAGLGGQFAETAAPFTPSSDFQFGQIDIALVWNGGLVGSGSNSVVLTLNSDSNGLPGAVLETWSLVGTAPFSFDPSPIVQTVSATAPLELLAGAQYWVVAAPGSSVSRNAWYANTLGVTTPFAHNLGSGFELDTNGVPTPAFDVQDSTAPEPSTLALYAISLVALGTVVRCRRRSFRRWASPRFS